MRTSFAFVVICGSVACGQESQSQMWDFEDAAVGKVPSGWTAAKTGDGEGSAWRVVEDKSAPSGARVLAQLAAGPSPLFNLCLADRTNFQDLELSVAFKAVDGKVDQGGGVVWRCLDANNYYIARFNPLEDNFRVYKVVDGKRTQLATRENLKAPAGEWHTLAIKMRGHAMECFLNGTKHLEATDSTFTKGSRIGLWTKADAQTHFDSIEVKALE